MNTPEFDIAAAHKYFSAYCFNQAWNLLEKPDRNSDENEQMIRLSMASHWHWTQREDFTPTNQSVSYWQLSRIYAVLGDAGNAQHYAEKCLVVSQGQDMPPFYLAYAYEALARAASVSGNTAGMEKNRTRGIETAQSIADKEEQQWVLDDLKAIQ